MTRNQQFALSLYNSGIYTDADGNIKRLLSVLGCIEISSHVIRYENNQFHLFRRGPASEGQTVDGLLNELNGRRIVMNEEQFENWMNEEI